MTPLHARRQCGIALIALLAILAIGASAFLVKQLNAESGAMNAIRKNRNTEVLNRAKQALIGYVIAQAAKAGENNPGALPCPEGAGFVGDVAKEGTSAPTVGAPTCASVGRYPWRTIGVDNLIDTAGEPLWYVVGPIWRKSSTTTLLNINSNTLGDVTVDGSTVVALIVAPGPAMTVQASTGCTARAQMRVVPSPAMNALDYLECFDAATLQFVTTAPSTSLNDQVVRVTLADVLPGIEAAVAVRIEREVAPLLKSIYGTAQWSLAGSPLFPYAAPFTDPGASTYLGVAGTYAGLLPFSSQSAAMTWNTGTAPAFWTSTPAEISGTPSCTFNAAATRARCRCRQSDGCTYNSTAAATQFRITATTQQTLLTGMHQLDSTKVMLEYRPAGSSIPYTPVLTVLANASINSTGTATIVSEGTLTLAAGAYDMQIYAYSNTVVDDHPLLDTSDAATGWFARNEWHRLLYYAVARGHTLDKLPPVCPTAVPFVSSCLTVANVAPAGSQRAFLILAGRSVNGTARPSSTLGDYLEFGNATAAYERRTVSAANAIAPAQRFNDRIVVIDSN